MDRKDWLCKRNRLTEELRHHPYDMKLYLKRATAYEHLGFPDLAAGDAYRALLLADEVQDDSGEYHQDALDALRLHWKPQKANSCSAGTNTSTEDTELDNKDNDLNIRERKGESVPDVDDDELRKQSQGYSLECYHLLCRCLIKCGCLRSAFDFCTRALSAFSDPALSQQRDAILLQHRKRKQSQDPAWDELYFDPRKDLPDQGSVRRELYPWNKHEPDRFSEATLKLLNRDVSKVAPKCMVHAVSLPLLTEDGSHALFADRKELPLVKQLGLFAKEDIAAGEIVLNESSVLTANNRLHHPLCDACSSKLPDLASSDTTFACDECDDTVFCSQICLNLAKKTYHPALCGRDVEAIGKETDPLEAANALYLLLLGRIMALAETQEVHPLDLKEVKYISGDFVTAEIAYLHSESASTYYTARHLPFSFTYNVLLPLHVLERMDIDIFASLAKYDIWILNTLYAKFRGTASARLSKQDGRPEVCAVHPVWCLANHSCDPNVTWEWGGDITFRAREERIEWGGKGKRKGGIKKGEEVLNHYCDIGLGHKERRQWAAGALGGMCVCDRCIWEESQQAKGDSNGDSEGNTALVDTRTQV
ncbi:hypothetical protein MMC16_002305 [Acarospora aff. strigata]|nr:hypothetical protein [Acarospora aff. strigata]